MKVINSQIGNLVNDIKPIDDTIIMELTQLALKCTKETERFNLRDDIYKSKYKANNLENKELELERYLQQIDDSNIRTKNQDKEYKWVKINTHNMGDVSYRFYIAPNPEKMHEIVKKLVEAFRAKRVPVRFKYQLTTNMEHCDRIIIYSDSNNRKLVEESIKSVYQSSEELFKGSEHSIAWLYNSEIPHVYVSPETPGDAYSNIFSDAIIEAKETFNFLYGITNSNNNIKLFGKAADEAIEYMKILICSILLQKGIILSKDGNHFEIKNEKTKMCYDYNTGILERLKFDSNGCFRVKFYPTDEGKNALLANFYHILEIQPQKGLDVRYLTHQERQVEVHQRFHPEYYNSTGKKTK